MQLSKGFTVHQQIFGNFVTRLSIEGSGKGVSKNEMVTPMAISLFKTHHLSIFYYNYFHTMIH
jgi:hypothetical protein